VRPLGGPPFAILAAAKTLVQVTLLKTASLQRSEQSLLQFKNAQYVKIIFLILTEDNLVYIILNLYNLILKVKFKYFC